MTYGLGDHMLDHLSHSLYTIPIFATVGIVEKPIRPLAIQDLLAVLRACAVDSRLSRQTVAVVGAEELLLSQAVRRVARILGKRVFVVRCPITIQRVLASIVRMDDDYSPYCQSSSKNSLGRRRRTSYTLRSPAR
jgi:uncharacterized protein YbjT (DUF2867 family)